jgi:hypothetical protein
MAASGTAAGRLGTGQNPKTLGKMRLGTLAISSRYAWKIKKRRKNGAWDACTLETPVSRPPGGKNSKGAGV